MKAIGLTTINPPLTEERQMKDKIQSITEAFSMQPCTYHIGAFINGGSPECKVATIELEIISYPINGDPFDYRYFVGRNMDGKILFQFRAETVSVTYNQTK